MEHTTSTRHGDRARHTRARAFAGRTQEGYRTPDWLERSFVLPVDDDATDLPEMPLQVVPSHDDLTPREPDEDVAAHVFVRPATPEVDFAAVVQRCDAARRARVLAGLLLVLAVLAAVGALVAQVSLAVPTAVVLTAGAVAAAVWSVGQSRAPVPLRG